MIHGKFTLLSRLGAGAYGQVYLAAQRPLNRYVAIKLLLHRHSEKPEMLRRFWREATTLSQVNHPNVVTVFDFGTLEEGTGFLAMEYVQGHSLKQELRQQGRLPLPRALHLAEQLADGLAAAHDRLVFHRDLKPENVLLTTVGDRRDFVKIVDFGIALILEGAGGLDTQARAAQPRVVVGTPFYMAPEQVLNQPQDHRVDIYALGVLLYELLTGRFPYLGEDGGELRSGAEFHGPLMRAHVQQPLVPISRRATLQSIPPELEQLLAEALQKQPERRPSSMRSLRDRLRLLRERIRQTTPLPLVPGTDLASPAIDQPSGDSPGQPSGEQRPAAPDSGSSPSGERRSSVEPGVEPALPATGAACLAVAGAVPGTSLPAAAKAADPAAAASLALAHPAAQLGCFPVPAAESDLGTPRPRQIRPGRSPALLIAGGALLFGALTCSAMWLLFRPPGEIPALAPGGTAVLPPGDTPGPQPSSLPGWLDRPLVQSPALREFRVRLENRAGEPPDRSLALQQLAVQVHTALAAELPAGRPDSAGLGIGPDPLPASKLWLRMQDDGALPEAVSLVEHRGALGPTTSDGMALLLALPGERWQMLVARYRESVALPCCGIQLGRPLPGWSSRGSLVLALERGGAAQRAGLRPGDVLLRQDEAEAADPAALASWIQGQKPPRLRLKLLRPGQEPSEREILLPSPPAPATASPHRVRPPRPAPRPSPRPAPGTGKPLDDYGFAR
ncbi:MAG: hypothetical protein FJ125_02925 [Deltaproteobacteria bacterium]|nr:hypothetical protein [Deltaproteobacteria bacterium]